MFSLLKFDHVGAQCPDKKKNPGNNQQKKPAAKASKGKGKGKMHELTEQECQDESKSSGEVLMPLILPLISSMETSDDEWKWWLIDSGAAVSGLSEQFKGTLQVQCGRAGDGYLLRCQRFCSHHAR